MFRVVPVSSATLNEAIPKNETALNETVPSAATPNGATQNEMVPNVTALNGATPNEAIQSGAIPNETALNEAILTEVPNAALNAVHNAAPISALIWAPRAVRISSQASVPNASLPVRQPADPTSVTYEVLDVLLADVRASVPCVVPFVVAHSSVPPAARVAVAHSLVRPVVGRC